MISGSLRKVCTQLGLSDRGGIGVACGHKNERCNIEKKKTRWCQGSRQAWYCQVLCLVPRRYTEPQRIQPWIKAWIFTSRVCTQSYPILSNPMDCSPLGSSVHSIFPEEYCSGLPFPPREGLPHPGIQPVCPVSLALTGRFPTTEPHRKPFTSPQAANSRVNLTSSRRESSLSEWGK